MRKLIFFLFSSVVIFFSCEFDQERKILTISPKVTTDYLNYDSDDPAIWVHPTDPSKSLVLGTDKDTDGALYVFDLQGRVDSVRTFRGIKRPNNVDIEYGLQMDSTTSTDIAVVTEREREGIRIFSLPDMQPIDGGGLSTFKGEPKGDFTATMGIALYKRPGTGEIHAIVGRKGGPTDSTYLWQYRLVPDSTGQITLQLLRKFGAFSGKAEIEAIAVDDALGYIYYSDEGVGVRKYYADPAKGNDELALFGEGTFKEDNEGIAILAKANQEGFIIVSNQQDQSFNVFPRKGPASNPHQHDLLGIIPMSTEETDGCEVSGVNFGPSFPNGLFVAMSTDRTFQFYDLADLQLDSLAVN
ncbi:MAG: phytase [Bacteroidota bacterium]